MIPDILLTLMQLWSHCGIAEPMALFSESISQVPTKNARQEPAQQSASGEWFHLPAVGGHSPM